MVEPPGTRRAKSFSTRIHLQDDSSQWVPSGLALALKTPSVETGGQGLDTNYTKLIACHGHAIESGKTFHRRDL